VCLPKGTGWVFAFGGAGDLTIQAAGPGLIKNSEISCAVCAKENPLWGAPRIPGELLKLGFNVAQSTVSKYMLKRRGPPSQGWKTFLRNHADGIASVDFLIVPTLTFERLFVFVILKARTPSPSMDRRHDQSDGGMAGPPDYRSLSLGHCSGF